MIMPECHYLMISLPCLISVIAGRQGQTEQEQTVEHQQQGLRPQRRQHGPGQHRELRVTQLRLQPGVSVTSYAGRGLSKPGRDMQT